MFCIFSKVIGCEIVCPGRKRNGFEFLMCRVHLCAPEPGSASWAARILHCLMLCSNHLTVHFGELLQTDECIRSTDIMQSSSKVHSHVHVNLFACKNLSRSDLIYGFSSAKRISEMFIQFHRERHCVEGEKINLFPLQP